MPLRYALLALLADGEAHGYQLLKRFGQRLGPFWHPNIGQVYQLLHDLERRRLIVRRDELHGTRSRRLFRLTERGERALRLWLARRPSWPPPVRDEIFVRFLAAERHGPEAVRSQLDRQEAEYRRYLALIHEEDVRAGSSVTRRMAHEAALGHAEAHLRWLARCRELIPERPETPSRVESGGEGGAFRDPANAVPRPAKPARQNVGTPRPQPNPSCAAYQHAAGSCSDTSAAAASPTAARLPHCS